MDFGVQFVDKVRGCELSIGYSFHDKIICAEALNAAANVMALYRDRTSPPKLPKNDRLAVYGDVVASRALRKRWYDSGDDKGLWTRIRNAALSNDTLANIGFEKGLNNHVNLNSGTIQVSRKMIATAAEAILGTVHLDGGDDALTSVMERLGILVSFQIMVTFILLNIIIRLQ